MPDDVADGQPAGKSVEVLAVIAALSWFYLARSSVVIVRSSAAASTAGQFAGGRADRQRQLVYEATGRADM